jgi:hypothetical protein
VLIESTYGDRVNTRRQDCWSASSHRCCAGSRRAAAWPWCRHVAVGRAQALLHAITLLKGAQGNFPFGAGFSGQPDGRAFDSAVRRSTWVHTA